jgi:excisionase family DNA binding protein
MEQITDNYFTTAQAAARLGVTPSAIRKAISERKLAAVKMSRRLTLIDPSDLEAYERRHHGRKGWAKRRGEVTPEAVPVRPTLAEIREGVRLLSAQERYKLMAADPEVLGLAYADLGRAVMSSLRSLAKSLRESDQKLPPFIIPDAGSQQRTEEPSQREPAAPDQPPSDGEEL